MEREKERKKKKVAVETIVNKKPNPKTGKHYEREIETERSNSNYSFASNHKDYGWDKGIYDAPQSKKETKNEITDLNLSEKGISGHLELNYPNLEKLDCSDNKITSLDLSKCPKLKELYCWYNDLTILDLRYNPNLEVVDCFANNLKINLSVFSHLTKLKRLDLGVYTKRGTSFINRTNDFSGSLKSLESCKQLEYLCIGQNERIKEGLEYLPLGNLTYFGCFGNYYKEQLKPFDYDIRAWMLVNYPRLYTDSEQHEISLLEVGVEMSKEALERLLQENPEGTKRIERLNTKIEKMLNQIEIKN